MEGRHAGVGRRSRGPRAGLGGGLPWSTGVGGWAEEASWKRQGPAAGVRADLLCCAGALGNGDIAPEALQVLSLVTGLG